METYRIMAVDECGTECCLRGKVLGMDVEHALESLQKLYQEHTNFTVEEENQGHYYEESYE